MKKKVFICTLVLFILGTVGVFATTDELPPEPLTMAEIAQEAGEGLQVISPDRDVTISKQSLILEVGAKEGTEILIQVYYNTSPELDKPKYAQAGDPISLKMGALKLEFQEIELKKGKNKIEVTATYADGSTETVVRYIEVNDVEEVQRKILEGNISDSNSLINTITKRK